MSSGYVNYIHSHLHRVSRILVVPLLYICSPNLLILTFGFDRVGPRSLTPADENINFLLINDWLSNCRLNHKNCNNATKDFLPTRLLDLEAFDKRLHSFEDDIKLVCSVSFHSHSPKSVPDYVTLSHCWGPPEKRPVITTHANLVSRMERISFTELPRTFQDAVVLARRLGQRYLWIDSLCIIQDDEGDWANEASMMSEVYTQSYCTLAALSSADSTEGLRVSNRAGTDTQGLIMDFGTSDGRGGLVNIRLFEHLPKAWQGEYDGSDWNINGRRGYRQEDLCPLRYRAWVLQEKELSTRSIQFGFRQLLWECRELKATSELPWDTRRRVRRFEPYDTTVEYTRAYIPPEDILSCTMRVHWLELCEEYSRRLLTNQTDKLPALSGVARPFQKYFPKDMYIAGIWSSHLPVALLWRPLRQFLQRRTTEYIAPTWSWTNQPYGIIYNTRTLHDLFRKMASKTSGPEDKWFDDLEVVSTEKKLKYNDEYGTLEEGATLELRGALLFELDSKLHRSNGVFFYKDGLVVGKFWPDVDNFPLGKWVCLGIFCSNESGVQKVTGLILKEHVRDGGPVYSRVGYVSELSPSLWDDAEPRQITLI